MLAEGVRLTIVGMVTVFAFLGVLVGMMHASAAFFSAFGDRFDPPAPAKPARDRPSQRDEDIAVVLAIAEHLGRNAPN